MTEVNQSFTVVNKTRKEIILPYVEGGNPLIPAGATVTRSYQLRTYKAGRHGMFDSPPDTAKGGSSVLDQIGQLIDAGVISMTPDPRALAGASVTSAISESPVGAGDIRLVGGGSSGSRSPTQTTTSLAHGANSVPTFGGGGKSSSSSETGCRPIISTPLTRQTLPVSSVSVSGPVASFI